MPGAAMINTESFVLRPRVDRECIRRRAPIDLTLEPLDQLPFLLKDGFVNLISLELL